MQEQKINGKSENRRGTISMKKTESDIAHSGKTNDAVLSPKLGHYQRMELIYKLVGFAGMLGGIISFFTVQDKAFKSILVLVLFGGGICCVLFLSDGMQKKREALMRKQLDVFFHSELEKRFGPDRRTSKMCIDQLLLKTLCPRERQWEEYTAENFYEGNYRSIHFSIANVRLVHTYTRGNIRDGLGTWRNIVFKGVVLRCKTRIPAPSIICVNMRTKDSPHGVVTDNETFDSCFCITADMEQDVFYLLTTQFMEWIITFNQRLEGQIMGLCWENNVFSLAIETDYGFASIASDVDMSNLDAVRCSYSNSLWEMEKTLDLLLKNTALFGDEIEKGKRI